MTRPARMGPITGVVLAGGEGRRMGGPVPKAWLEGPHGRPLVVGALDALRAAGATDLRVVARAGDLDPRFAQLRATTGVPVVQDRAPGLGPLAGLEAALADAPFGSTTEWSIVVACDMPRLDPSLLRRLAQRALASTHAAVVPRLDGRPEPLHAAYHRRCLQTIREALDAGRLRLTDLVTSLDPEWLDVGDDPRERASFDNWNTPEDVR